MLLGLVAATAGFLAPPAEAAKRPFADIVAAAAARRHGVDPDLVQRRHRRRAQGTAHPRNRPAQRA